jgi:hypothetical protein
MTAVLAVAVAVLSAATPALAGAVVYLPVPEPGTLSLLSGGAALVVLGARWFRRK